MPDYTNDIYDVEKAFQSIEDELIKSMMRNMQHHRDWEDDEGFRWSQWQTEQLKALEKYKQNNRKVFTSRFSDINSKIDTIISNARQQGGMDQEIAILQAIKNGHLSKKLGKSLNTTGEFFRLNDRKLNALITATHDDFAKAEFAMLRQADDQYRKIIFNAEMYANSGAGTYARAVDMATKDFLARGITCIEYKNGARHTMADYASMCLRTASKRAYFVGEGEKRQEWGEHLVILNKRGNACPLCLPFVGKVLIDDVWSGGSPADGNYPLMSAAVEAGLYHPNCKDGHTTYFPEIADIEEKYSSKEMQQLTADYQQEQKKKYIQNMIKRYDRLASNSLDRDNKKKYQSRVDNLKSKLVKIMQSDIIKVSQELHIKGVASTEFDKIDITDYFFDSDHINKRRQHMVTKEQAQSFINNAKVEYRRWEGKVSVYVSKDGVSVLNHEDKIVSTAYSSSEYDEKFKKIKELFEDD